MKIVGACLVAMAVCLFSFLIFRTGASCETPPVEGIVTAKQWIPAHDDMYFLQIYDGNGGFTQVPQWVHYDDEWRIYVGSRHAKVSKEKFKAVEIQGYFTNRPGN